MASLGNLTVDLRTNSAKFVQGMDSARGSLKGFQSQVVNVKGALVALVGAGGFGLLVKSSLSAVDALAKTSDKLGLATEKLAGLRHAAELTGVSSQTMDMALQRMTRRLAEAAQGGGEAKAAIEQLGLDAQKLAAQSPDKSFNEIAAAMESVTSQSEKVRLAFKFFDSEGVALVNTLSLGAAGLDQASASAQKLGIAVTRIDAAKVEAANNAMVKAQAVFKGAGQALSVELAPYIEAAANAFVTAATEAGGFGVIAVNVTEATVMGLSKVADVVRGLHVVWKGLEVIVLGFGAAMTLTINQVVEGWREIANLVPGVDLAPVQMLQNVTNDSVLALSNARAELKGLVEQEMPSEGVREFFAAIREGAENAAIGIAKIHGGESAESGATAKGGGLLGLTDEQMEAELDAADAQFKELERLHLDHARRSMVIENQKSQMMIGMAQTVANAAQGFISALPGEHEKAAKAIFVIQKGLAIAQSIVNTQVAKTAALAIDPTGILAARVELMGNVATGLIAATAFLTPYSGGGSDAGGGGGVAPANLDPVRDIGDGVNPGGDDNRRGGSVTINVNGVITDEIVQEVMLPALRDAIDDKDEIIIRNNSRQAAELRA